MYCRNIFWKYLVAYLAKSTQAYCILRRDDLEHTHVFGGYVQNIELAAAFHKQTKRVVNPLCSFISGYFAVKEGATVKKVGSCKKTLFT